MAGVREVDADLMGAAGVESEFEVREFEIRIAVEYAVLGAGGAAVAGAGRHASAADGVALDGLLVKAMVTCKEAVGEGEVDLFDRAGGELGSEGAVRGVGTGDEENAAGVAVKAVHDAGARIAAGLGEPAEAMEERVDERAAVVTRTEMDHHARGLVDGDDGVVFIKDVHRQILGKGAQRRRRGGLNADRFAAAECQGRLGGGLAGDAHPARLDPLLQAGARVLGEMVLQEVIEALVGVRGSGGELDGRVGHSLHSLTWRGCAARFFGR